MTTFTWSVVEMSTLPDVPNQPNYVVLVRAKLKGVEDDVIGLCIVNVQIQIFDDIPDYTLYDQLTEEQVIGWVLDTLTPEGVASAEANVQNQIDLIINPPVVPTPQPLPWA